MAECNRCEFQTFVTGISSLLKRCRTVENGKSLSLSAPAYMARRAKSAKVRRAAKALASAIDPLLDAIDHSILPLAREVCSACSQCSDDDNPSHHGRVFVSLDAMAPAAADISGTYSADDEASDRPLRDDDAFFNDDEGDDPDDDNQGNWLNRNAIKVPPSSSSSGVTKLPTHIEDALRKVLHQFAALDIFEQNLVLQQMSGQTFADFGSMGWVPDDMKHPQSKQLVSARWDRIVKKFPVAAALRKIQPLKGLNTPRNKKFSEERYEQGILPIPYGFPGPDKSHPYGRA